MPTYRIIHSTTNGTPTRIHSTFQESSDETAYHKFQKIIDTNEYLFSYLWLERYNTDNNTYEVVTESLTKPSPP